MKIPNTPRDPLMITSNLDEIHFCCYFSCCCCCRFWLVSLCEVFVRALPRAVTAPLFSFFFSRHSSLLYSPLVIYTSPLQLHTLFPEKNAFLFASADATYCLSRTSCSTSPFTWLFLLDASRRVNQPAISEKKFLSDRHRSP